jgi:hypothetical protein
MVVLALALATWETEAGGLLESRNLNSLGNTAKHYLKKN